MFLAADKTSKSSHPSGREEPPSNRRCHWAYLPNNIEIRRTVWAGWTNATDDSETARETTRQRTA